MKRSACVFSKNTTGNLSDFYNDEKIRLQIHENDTEQLMISSNTVTAGQAVPSNNTSSTYTGHLINPIISFDNEKDMNMKTKFVREFDHQDQASEAKTVLSGVSSHTMSHPELVANPEELNNSSFILTPSLEVLFYIKVI